ncbi:hypothetical protein GCM10028796_31570 [Ramlibacter monticola]|uniref:AlpA family phage regulatory protein n=1 Tax=Ramlibacter monticola TaxID=1926872 RepID=A0A936Z623_9BURK|nr:hypothetical protein [Ramlibacter monticola]MBL0394270.1 hypothetical protein [Ramlibacter monticola]
MSKRAEFSMIGRGQNGASAGEQCQPVQQSAHSPNIAPLLLTPAQAASFVGVGESTFQALRNEPWMPLPIVLGPRIVRWSRIELEQAVANMPRVREPSEPAQLMRARIDRMKRGSHA